MAIFDNEEELNRRKALKELEDKRLRFAEELARKAFKPEQMLFCSDEGGSFTAIARDGRGLAIIKGATFAQDDDFRLILQETPCYTRQDIQEKGTGLNGMFGFGRKPAYGFILHFNIDEENPVDLCCIAGRTSFMYANKYERNLLLSTKRRRKDANIVWEFKPVESKDVQHALKLLDEVFLK